MRIDPLLRALSEPTRLRIMRLLAHMELAVGELAQVLGQSQPRVSRHIRILCDAGLAERRKEGSWVFLRSAVSENGNPPLGAAAAALLAIAERDDTAFSARCAEDRRQLAAIRASREASAEARDKGRTLAHELAAARARRDTVVRRLAELDRLIDAVGAETARERALQDDAAKAVAALEAERGDIERRLADAETIAARIAAELTEAEAGSREAEAAVFSETKGEPP